MQRMHKILKHKHMQYTGLVRHWQNDTRNVYFLPVIYAKYKAGKAANTNFSSLQCDPTGYQTQCIDLRWVLMLKFVISEAEFQNSCHFVYRTELVKINRVIRPICLQCEARMQLRL